MKIIHEVAPTIIAGAFALGIFLMGSLIFKNKPNATSFALFGSLLLLLLTIILVLKTQFASATTFENHFKFMLTIGLTLLIGQIAVQQLALQRADGLKKLITNLARHPGEFSEVYEHSQTLYRTVPADSFARRYVLEFSLVENDLAFFDTHLTQFKNEAKTERDTVIFSFLEIVKHLTLGKHEIAESKFEAIKSQRASRKHFRKWIYSGKDGTQSRLPDDDKVKALYTELNTFIEKVCSIN